MLEVIQIKPIVIRDMLYYHNWASDSKEAYDKVYEILRVPISREDIDSAAEHIIEHTKNLRKKRKYHVKSFIITEIMMHAEINYI